MIRLNVHKNKRLPDIALIAVVTVLVSAGMVFIYSASMYSAEKTYGDAFYLVKKQAVGAVLGIVAMFACSRIPLKFIRKFSFVLYIVSLVLLALVFVPGIGIENYGAKRWVGFGSFSFQPSEIAKFALVGFSAAYLSRKGFTGKRFSEYFPVALAGGAVCLLVIMEPNMSVTVCVALVTMVMMFIGGAGLRGFAVTFACGAAALPVLIIAEPYRLRRLAAFLDPFASPKEEGYQLLQSLYALGSGGFLGVGLFNSRQKYKFLPFAESDFIFSIIGEEAGFLGALLIVVLFGVLVWRGVVIAASAPTRFTSLLAGGITAVIAVQALINIAVVTGSIPPTGIPLPFVSYGGTSLVAFMGAVGLLLNIACGGREDT